MASYIYQADMTNRQWNIRARLELYLFREKDVYIMYCPALDLSGYGMSEEEAKESFNIVFSETLQYSLNKETLHSYLKKQGWNVKGKSSRNIKAPEFKVLYDRNDEFRDIIDNKDYSKISKELEFANEYA